MPKFSDAPEQRATTMGERHAAMPSPDEAKAQFRRDAAARGVLIPDDIVADGEIQRCDTTGRHGEDDGAYLLHLDGLPAGGFQNHQDGIGWQKWHADPGRPLSPAETDELRRRREADKIKRKAARDAAKAEGEEKAREVWKGAEDDWFNCYYLRNKGIEKAHGARREHSGFRTVVPMYDDKGVLRNVQQIDKDGEKRFIKHAPVAGLSVTIGDIESSDAILVGTGFATCATAHEATDRAVVVAFSDENLETVATTLRNKYPAKPLVILADDDWQKPGNPGLTKARAVAKAVSGLLAVPQFDPNQQRPEKATDFNDVGRLYGPEKVKRQIFEAQRVGTQDILLPDAQSGNAAGDVTLPARTAAEVDALIKTLDRHSADAEGQRQTMTMAMRGLARLNFGIIDEVSVLKQISSRTGLPLLDLKKAMAAIKREMGIKTVATPETTVICRRYVFVMKLNAFFDRASRDVFDLQAVRNRHIADMPLDPEIGKPLDTLRVLLEGAHGGPTCDLVDIISFVPGENEIFQEGESVALNIWKRPDLVPVEGDVTLYLDHVYYILDGERVVIDHFLDYCAHLVQKPAEKIKNTVLIIGDPGIGKSALGEVMMHLLGDENCTAIEDSDLRSAFNEWMDGIQLVLINELMSIESRETQSRLKGYITDPWIRINRKKVPTYKYRNRVNFMMFSNHEDAARLDKGDRRYLVWISKAKPREDAYYDAFWDWFRCKGGAERVLFFLQQRDLSKFNPNTAPPVTKAKLDVIADSRNQTEAYLQDLFDADAPPFRHDLVVVTDLIQYLDKEHRRAVTHKQVAAFLRKIGAELLGQKRLKNGTKPSVWAIRNTAEWGEVSEADIRDRAWKYINENPLTKEERNKIWGRTFA